MEIETCLAYLAAYGYALQFGQDPDEADDCASDHLEREWLAAGSLEDLFQRCENSPGLVRKCASDFAKNWVRGVYRRHESGSEPSQSEDARALRWNSLAGQPEPDAKLLRESFWAVVMDELAFAQQDPGNWFVRHHRYDEPIIDIAYTCGKDPNVVAVAIFRVRRGILRRWRLKGVTEADLRGYL